MSKNPSTRPSDVLLALRVVLHQMKIGVPYLDAQEDVSVKLNVDATAIRDAFDAGERALASLRNECKSWPWKETPER